MNVVNKIHLPDVMEIEILHRKVDCHFIIQPMLPAGLSPGSHSALDLSVGEDMTRNTSL